MSCCSSPRYSRKARHAAKCASLSMSDKGGLTDLAEHSSTISHQSARVNICNFCIALETIFPLELLPAIKMIPAPCVRSDLVSLQSLPAAPNLTPLAMMPPDSASDPDRTAELRLDPTPIRVDPRSSSHDHAPSRLESYSVEPPRAALKLC